MNRRMVFRRAARAEFDAAGDWYERQRHGLGVFFTSAIERGLGQIAEMPVLHQVVLHDIRRAVVLGFPYCVFYRVRPKEIVVLSVFHAA